MLLDDTVLPEIDDFLREAVPLAVTLMKVVEILLQLFGRHFLSVLQTLFHLNKEQLLKIIEPKYLKHSRPETMSQAWNGRQKV